jgi:transcription antitermination factor NusG
MSSLAWYALRVRSNHEFLVPSFLTAKGYENLSPSYSMIRQRCDEVKETNKPLFPGYVFCRFDPEVPSECSVIRTPGVVKIVSFGGKPAPLDPDEMNAVLLVVQTGFAPEPFPYLHPGMIVRIIRGPLSGLEGRFVKAKNRELLILSVSLLQRSISVEINQSSVEWEVYASSQFLPNGMRHATRQVT